MEKALRLCTRGGMAARQVSKEVWHQGKVLKEIVRTQISHHGRRVQLSAAGLPRRGEAA